MPDYFLLIGKKVTKTAMKKGTPKPFKSGLKVNTVKGIINHPQLNIPAFIFEEDNSYVECRRCAEIYECIITETYICPHKRVRDCNCFFCKLPARLVEEKNICIIQK
jgi:hypothetical protein